MLLAGMVLMVVVVVAVGGVFTRLFVYHGEPRLPSALWINLWKDLREANDRNTTLDGPAMCKIGYLVWVGHVQKWKDNGPKERRRRHFVLSFCYDVYKT